MSFEDGATFEAKPSSTKHAAENAHGDASFSFTDAGCGNSSPCNSPWVPWSLLHSQCSPNSIREFPRIDRPVDDVHTFSRNLHESTASQRNPTSDVENPINSVNLDTQSDHDNPLLGPTEMFDQQIASGCSSPIKLGTRNCLVVQREEQCARDKSGNSDLLSANRNDNGISIALSIRYPFEIFSDGNTSKSDSEEGSDTFEETSYCSSKLEVHDISKSKRQHVESSLPFHVKPPVNKNDRTPILEIKEIEKWSKISNYVNVVNTDRQQSKQLVLHVCQKLDHPQTNTRAACTRSDLSFNKNSPFQHENQLKSVQYNISGLDSVNKTESLSNSVENSRTSEKHNLNNCNPQTNTFKGSIRKPGSKAVSDTAQCSIQALPTHPSVNNDSDKLQHYPTKAGNLLSTTNNNLRPQSRSQNDAVTHKRDTKPASPQRNTKSTFHIHEHTCLSTCVQSVSIKQSKCNAVPESSAGRPVSSDKCCQDKRCTSSRSHHPDTGAVAVSTAKHAVNRNTVPASSLSTVEGMAGQNHHHLSRTVLDESAPRVPVHPPPLDNSDVMGVPERNVDDLLFQDQQRTSSLSTSFADLMLGDHTALRHKGRDGRLGRCGEGCDSTRLYGLSEAATIANLRETVLALQLQNTQLSLCLQQERSRREQAESLVDQEKGYIKRLEDTIQTLKSTRLVIDPNMYRQIAESYIAARKAPVRRTCSSSQQHPGLYEDLVCDSSPDNSLSPSPTSPNPMSSSQFLINDAMRPGGSNPTYMSPSASSTSTNDSFATHPPFPSTNTTTLPPQPRIFNERQNLRWPSERRENNFSPDDYLLRDHKSRDNIAKRRDV